MTDLDRPRVPGRTLLAIALLSASLLALQVLLTRVCALRLHFHFGFLVISNSLLGIGASGSLLSLCERRWRRRPEAWTFGWCIAYLVSLVVAWALLLQLPVPPHLDFTRWSWGEAGQFSCFNLISALPFFCGGCAVGLILANHAANVGRVYGADLLGAGLGCLLCPLLLWPVGAGGVFLVVMALGSFAAMTTAPAGAARIARPLGFLLVLGCAAGAPFLDRWYPVPGKGYLDVTNDYTLKTVGRPIYSRWSANSRIDAIPLPEQMPRFMQARGSVALQMPLPKRQIWLMQDSDAGTMLSDFSGEPATLETLRRTMYSASFHMKEGTHPKVFIIGVGGAHDVWAAKIHGASLVRGIELNQGVLDVHHTVAYDYSKDLLNDPAVELVWDEGRTALMHQRQLFDVIQMTGIDTWTALSSGAYVLAENYLYTVEACRQMYQRLAPDGILQITRLAEERETIRLMANLHAALDPAAQADFAASVAALHTPEGLIAVMLKREPFTPEEVAQLERFADQNGIHKVVLPGRDLSGVLNGKFKKIQDFVTCEDKAAYIAGRPEDISPTTDDRPYFFSFHRWTRPESYGEKASQELLTGVSQGNPAFLLGQLGFSSLFAFLFVVAPLLFRRGGRVTRKGALRFFVYFAGLGIGFIFVEIALIQKFTLLLGQPLYSIVVTLFALLIFTGCGSLLSSALLRRGHGASLLIPAAIALLIGAVASGSQELVSMCIGWSLPERVAVTVAVIAPLGLVLGMPFAHGIRLVERINPSFVPWAWAVNGSLTVVGSIVSVIVSMNFGFRAVLLAAVLIYLIAFYAIDRLARDVMVPERG
jgi:spermidine synthase